MFADLSALAVVCVAICLLYWGHLKQRDEIRRINEILDRRAQGNRVLTDDEVREKRGK